MIEISVSQLIAIVALMGNIGVMLFIAARSWARFEAYERRIAYLETCLSSRADVSGMMGDRLTRIETQMSHVLETVDKLWKVHGNAARGSTTRRAKST